jgi:hypothetical protein
VVVTSSLEKFMGRFKVSQDVLGEEIPKLDGKTISIISVLIFLLDLTAS